MDTWERAASKGIFEEGVQYRDLITDEKRAYFKARWEARELERRTKEAQEEQIWYWKHIVNNPGSPSPVHRIFYPLEK